MGEGGRKFVEQNFSWEIITEKFLQNNEQVCRKINYYIFNFSSVIHFFSNKYSIPDFKG